MNYYTMWCDLKEPSRDVEFTQHLSAYLQMLADDGRIAGFQIMRRKLGFGPPELGEFQITVHVEDLAQLDSAFSLAATREGNVEQLHAPVYRMVTNFRAALYRDFPDPGRKAAPMPDPRASS
jgi:Family of unknown function (DUF6614)